MTHEHGARGRRKRLPQQRLPKARSRAPLFDDLEGSARRFATSALKAYLDRRWDLFVLDAGASLEHLSKSCLASLHPSLVVDGKDFNNLLRACGYSDLVASGHIIRTITAGDAVKRCAQLLPHLASQVQEVEPILAVRNSVAHLGVLDEDAASRMLIPFITFSERLIDASGGRTKSFWGSFHPFVEDAKATAKSEDDQRVTILLERARRHFRSTYGRYDDALREAMLQAVVDSYDLPSTFPEKYEHRLLPCPSCDTPALVTGWIEPVWEPDDEQEPPTYDLVLVTFWPDSLRCKACHLELSGDAETTAAGLLVIDIDFDETDFSATQPYEYGR